MQNKHNILINLYYLDIQVYALKSMSMNSLFTTLKKTFKSLQFDVDIALTEIFGFLTILLRKAWYLLR